MRWPACVLQWVEGDEVEKLKQHSIKNRSHIAQWVEQLTCIHQVVGLNPAGEHFFSEHQYFLHTHFLKFSFDSTVTWHSKHGTSAKLNACQLGIRRC